MKTLYFVGLSFLISFSALFAQDKVEKINKIEGKVTEGPQTVKVESPTAVNSTNATTAVASYDFTTSAQQYHGGTAACKFVGMNGPDSVFAMVAGDANGDGQLTTLDYDLWLPNARAGVTGYENSDLNLDGQNTTLDYDLWLPNARAGRTSMVP